MLAEHHVLISHGIKPPPGPRPTGSAAAATDAANHTADAERTELIANLIDTIIAPVVGHGNPGQGPPALAPDILERLLDTACTLARNCPAVFLHRPTFPAVAATATAAANLQEMGSASAALRFASIIATMKQVGGCSYFRPFYAF